MWEMLWDVLGFLIKSGVVMVVVIVLIAVIRGGREGEEAPEKGQLSIQHLNEELRSSSRRFRSALVPRSARAMADKAFTKDEKARQKDAQQRAKQTIKERKRNDKIAKKQGARELGGEELTFSDRPRMFVLDFKGDVQASAVEGLRREVSAILDVAGEGDRVLLKLHNSGGYVHTHGLAASQLKRLRDGAIELWISVDQVAASGGYLMACVADRICAAPFSIIGSIGVIAQLPNVNRLLKRLDVDVELHTAGKFKRTLTTLGENTAEGREKFIEDLNTTHELFKSFVQEARPSLHIEQVATGETWLGTQALEVGLIDELKTSDELIIDAIETYDVYAVRYVLKRSLGERFMSVAHGLLAGRLPGQV